MGFASYADSAIGSSGRHWHPLAGQGFVSLVVDDRPVICNLFIIQVAGGRLPGHPPPPGGPALLDLLLDS